MTYRHLAMGAILAASPAITWAHAPLLDCYLNDKGSVTCEGGFSDGASAAGVAIRILDGDDRVISESELDEDGQITFDKPDFDYHVVFDAGSYHVVVLFGDEIE